MVRLSLKWKVVAFRVELRYRPISELSIVGSDDDEFDDFEVNLPRAVVSAVTFSRCTGKRPS